MGSSPRRISSRCLAADTLEVKPEPEYKRGASGAEYLSPGMLDTKIQWHGTFYVDPVDPQWPPEKVESYLRANDWYAITMVSAHEAYPGHHTQTWYAHQHPNPLRSTLWSGAFAEGWAVYGERLLIKEGLGGKENARYALREARSGMVVAANAILDIKLQRGEMTDEEALRFMEDEGFQEKALAEKKLLRAKLDSTQLCQYFLGLSEIEALERDVKGRGKFEQRAFNEQLVGHGTVPVKISSSGPSSASNADGRATRDSRDSRVREGCPRGPPSRRTGTSPGGPPREARARRGEPRGAARSASPGTGRWARLSQKVWPAKNFPCCAPWVGRSATTRTVSRAASR